MLAKAGCIFEPCATVLRAAYQLKLCRLGSCQCSQHCIAADPIWDDMRDPHITKEGNAGRAHPASWLVHDLISYLRHRYITAEPEYETFQSTSVYALIKMSL